MNKSSCAGKVAREISRAIFSKYNCLLIIQSFLCRGVTQQCYTRLACFFKCTTISIFKMYELKKQKVDNSCPHSEVFLH